MIIPQTMLRTTSPYNPDIRVVREWGGLKLLVNGSRQSGPYIRKLWEKAFNQFRLHDVVGVKRILVLGLGGGTVIELLAKRYPTAAVTAVDIDSTMISIAKQYFGIGKLPNVRLIQADAKAFVTKTMKPFDLIVIDLFFGRNIPTFVETKQFYQTIKRVLRDKGTVILNYLREQEYQRKSDSLLLKLKAVFRDVDDFSIANNRFFFCAHLTTGT